MGYATLWQGRPLLAASATHLPAGGIMPRLFIALDLPDEVVAALDRLCDGLPGIRWADTAQFHLTLRFIGEVDQGTFYEIGEALAGVSHAPFELALKGLGQAFAQEIQPATSAVLFRLPHPLSPCIHETTITTKMRLQSGHVT